MFSIILVIVGIALVVAMIAATMFHGGSDTMTKGKQEAEIAKSLNEVSQIKGALTQFHADTGNHATSLQDLVPKYLSSVPPNWGVEVPSQVAFESTRLLTGNEDQKLQSCREINARLGISSEPPACSDIDANFTGCCTVADGGDTSGTTP